ncbi:phage terminase large subunit [Sinorhizobium meliloti]|uniref:phage terminase large subunit n=1 Tax=Rhizobium meliloti TaxID=382 RepID=UPI000FDC8917|nr:phage terminase large subunit [Sinorhizobium meliloti]MDE3825870.1 phage terminase large subunit [Sinorhizobium meliloti]RVH87593.1 terminase [Sinorhizobium meliloti]RVI03664.1 terminase [Sinorhizobium meliloti]RVK94017.1 terminase [Sinorhizobium meliloti]RVM22447.1 terminase [Sinorhizobium meliloti]
MAGAEQGQGAQTIIRPQPGPQTAFLASAADIAIYGGSAGGGKTWALLMEPLRHIANPQFGAVFFRRSTVQVRNEGGLWDESEKLYPAIGASPKEHVLQWSFPSGASVSFAHLEHDKTVLNWQGSQIPLICFDELTHFSAKQFWYMVSRNRSMSGVRPYIRATCNPDADSWVAEFISWWVDQDTGLPIPERAGVLRWFVRIGDAIIWADSPQDLAHHTAPNEDGIDSPIPPKSVTFVPAKLSDNRALMAADPSYLASLMALPTVERERLLGGNWKIRPAAGLLFRRGWCEVVDSIPAGARWMRGWDLGATPKTESNDPDWTAGTKIGKLPDGRYIVAHHCRDRLSPSGVERLIKNTAESDGKDVQISLPQDPGQAGKSQVTSLTKLLAGFTVRATPESGDKITRFSPFSAQAEAGNVLVLRAPWNETWFSSLEGFPEAAHDDDADSTSRSFNALLSASTYTLANV